MIVNFSNSQGHLYQALRRRSSGAWYTLLQNACQTMALEVGRLRALCPAMKKQCGGRKVTCGSTLFVHCKPNPYKQEPSSRSKPGCRRSKVQKLTSAAVCADWYAREAAADTCGVMKIKHWVHIWTLWSKTYWIWWILQCRCLPLSQAPQAKLLVFILQIITADMFKYGEIFNWRHSVSQYQ